MAPWRWRLAASLLAGLRSSGVPSASTILLRYKTTSAQYVASRAMDPTFEKLMEGYKHFVKVVAVQDLILASPDHSLPLPLLNTAAQRLQLRRGGAAFVRAFPHVFSLHHDHFPSQFLVRLTPDATAVSAAESSAASACAPAAVERLVRLLTMSVSRALPLRAVFKVWRELGLPDDFEDSVLASNPSLFSIRDNPGEPNTHLLQLAKPDPHSSFFTPVVEQWRTRERCRDGSKADEMEIKYGFKQGFPPGMRLTKSFRSKLKEWQRLPYAGPYEPSSSAVAGGGRGGRRGALASEKRTVGMIHEFLSLTVERMVEVEKVSHFRRWFGIELNIRDLFLDHPGMFYLSTKGKRHTVFLREAYEKGRLVDPNPIYEARRRLLNLVLLRRRGIGRADTTLGEEQDGGGSDSDEMEA